MGRGGRILNRTLGFMRKFPSKFFGFVWSFAVFWILGLSKNITGVIRRTHRRREREGGKSLYRALEFIRKFPSRLFGFVWSSAVSWILCLSKNVTGIFGRTHSERITYLNGTPGLIKKNSFNIFRVCVKF